MLLSLCVLAVSWSSAAQTCNTANATSGADECYGNSNVQDVDLKAGDDLFDLRGGNDDGRGSQDKDFLLGGADKDELIGGPDRDKTTVSNEYIGVFGDNGEDDVFGGTGDDVVDGSWGIDKIYGEEDDDIVYSDEPNGFADDKVDDEVNGGGGTDFCYINSGENSVNCDGNTYVNTR